MDDLGFASAAPRGLQFDMPQKRRGGMFGGVSIDPGAFLAAFAAGMGSPAGMQALQALQQRRLEAQRLATEEQRYQRQRADQNADFIAHRQYEINNPLPKQPSEFDDALAATGVMPGTSEYAKAMQQRVQNMIDPVVMTPQGPVLRSMITGALQPPAKPVGKLTPIDDGGAGLGGPRSFLGF